MAPLLSKRFTKCSRTGTDPTTGSADCRACAPMDHGAAHHYRVREIAPSLPAPGFSVEMGFRWSFCAAAIQRAKVSQWVIFDHSARVRHVGFAPESDFGEGGQQVPPVWWPRPRCRYCRQPLRPAASESANAADAFEAYFRMAVKSFPIRHHSVFLPAPGSVPHLLRRSILHRHRPAVVPLLTPHT